MISLTACLENLGRSIADMGISAKEISKALENLGRSIAKVELQRSRLEVFTDPSTDGVELDL